MSYSSLSALPATPGEARRLNREASQKASRSLPCDRPHTLSTGCGTRFGICICVAHHRPGGPCSRRQPRSAHESTPHFCPPHSVPHILRPTRPGQRAQAPSTHLDGEARQVPCSCVLCTSWAGNRVRGKSEVMFGDEERRPVPLIDGSGQAYEMDHSEGQGRVSRSVLIQIASINGFLADNRE